MTLYQRSYLKTLLPAAVLMLIEVGLFSRVRPVGLTGELLCGLGWVLCLGTGMVVLSGLVVFWRDRALAAGREDLFLRLNRSRSEKSLEQGRPGLLSRLLSVATARSRGLRVGDEVEVLPLSEIQRTLTADASLDGLPFQPEMAAFCGQRFRVYRRVDKIHDYRRTGKMRRLRNAVSLVGLRCDGSAHDACQARCCLIWKEAWLRRVAPGEDRAATASPATTNVIGASLRSLGAPCEASSSTPPEKLFRCQFTQLAAASTPLHAWDVRQDLWPLISGNVTVRAFVIAVLTRLFNRVQTLRRGTPFPPGPTRSVSRTVQAAPVAPGEWVRVRQADEIGTTLDARGRNRGLWFDLDMLKFCDRSFVVAARVDRIIDAATRRMLQMKTPCLTLADVAASGEYLRFCSQHEEIFWREVWLRPDADHDTRTTTCKASQGMR